MTQIVTVLVNIKCSFRKNIKPSLARCVAFTLGVTILSLEVLTSNMAPIRGQDHCLSSLNTSSSLKQGTDNDTTTFSLLLARRESIWWVLLPQNFSKAVGIRSVNIILSICECSLSS